MKQVLITFTLAFLGGSVVVAVGTWVALRIRDRKERIWLEAAYRRRGALAVELTLRRWALAHRVPDSEVTEIAAHVFSASEDLIERAGLSPKPATILVPRPLLSDSIIPMEADVREAFAEAIARDWWEAVEEEILGGRPVEPLSARVEFCDWLGRRLPRVETCTMPEKIWAASSELLRKAGWR